MFLVNDGRERIEKKISQFFHKEPSIGLVIAAIFFEWSEITQVVRYTTVQT